MIRLAAPLVAALLIGGCAAAIHSGSVARQPGGTVRTGANLHNAQGRLVGDAIATQDGGLIRVRLNVRGLVPGTHGVHLHQSGRCDPPDFASAGPHWNPAGRQHGRLNPQGPHLGDLPNLQVERNGAGRVDFDLPVPAGAAVGLNPLLDEDGTAIVIHAAADDDRSDPAGNSGARVACGVFAPVR
jgi:Cu-Zn family superoxide dismutase